MYRKREIKHLKSNLGFQDYKLQILELWDPKAPPDKKVIDSIFGLVKTQHAL